MPRDYAQVESGAGYQRTIAGDASACSYAEALLPLAGVGTTLGR